MVDAPCPFVAKASSGSVTSTTPTRVLFKEPLEHSQGEQDQKTQTIQPQRIPETTTSRQMSNTPTWITKDYQPSPPEAIVRDGKTLSQLMHDDQYQYHWLQSITGNPIPQWCPLGYYCGLTSYCHYMHPPTWAGFPRDYCSDFERYVKHEELIVKVDPYRVPRWAISKVRVDAKLPVEYTGCWHGSKCPLVYNGECLRIHPEATEDMAYNTIREKRNELMRSEVNNVDYSNQGHKNHTSDK